jgi:hypothetical protein
MYAPIHDTYDWRFLNITEMPPLPIAEHQTRILYIPKAQDIEIKKAIVFDAHYNIMKQQYRPTEIIPTPYHEEMEYSYINGMAMMYIPFVENEYYFLILPFTLTNGQREYCPELFTISYNIPFRNRVIAKDIKDVIQIKIGEVPSGESLTNTIDSLRNRYVNFTREC